MDNKNLGLILMDKLYKKFNLDKYTSGASAKLRKLLIQDLLTSVKGDRELEYKVKKMSYFDFNQFEQIKKDLRKQFKINLEKKIKERLERKYKKKEEKKAKRAIAIPVNLLKKS